MGRELSELVVQLAFEHGNAASQVKQMTKEVSGMETSFRASVASMGGFSSGLEKAKAESKLFTDQLALQKRATEQLRGEMDGARAKLTADAQAYQAQTQKVEGLRAKQASLKGEITSLKSAMDQSKAATGDNTEEYIAMSLRLDELNTALKESEKDLKAQEAQLRKNDSAVASGERAVQASTRSYNEARIAQADIQKALDATNKRLKNHVAQLEDASKKMKAYGDRTRETGQAQSRIGQGLTMGVTTPVMAGLGASAGAAIGWESAFAGVRKTVTGTPEELNKINDELIDMSKNIPTSAEDLAGISANAGQLGIATGNVTGFTRTIADLKETTNLTAEQGAQDFAKFANITKMPQTAFSNMGSAVVALGNNLATTESDTVAMAMNLASAASQAKMTQAETLGIAAAFSSLGMEAQAGGTAISKTITEMQVAVETGSKDLKDYAAIAGMTAQEFATAFKTDAAGALSTFIAGLSSGTDSAVVMLDKMGITETRTRDALLRASGAGDLLTNSIKLSTDAWRENTALTNEANIRYQTTASRLQTLKNQTTAAAITLGNDLLPMINEGITGAGEWVEKFNDLDEATRKNILTFAGWAAAAGPAILLVGKGNEAVGAVATGLSKFTGAMATAGGGVSGFTSALGGLLGPVGIAALVGALGLAAYKWYDYASGAQAAREATEAMIATAKEWRDTQASTIYDTGNDPFSRFGLEKSDFGGGVDESRSWIDRLNQTWTDGKTETKQIVSDYVNEFKAGSDKVREAIEARKDTQAKYGVTGDQTTEEDLKKLKAYDKEVAALLKKKRGGKLTADDQQRLETIVQERVKIELKYTTGDGGGYDSIAQAVEAEKARLKAEDPTSTPGADLYADALSAGAQGYQTQVEAINQSYRDQYADIQAITDEKKKEAALTQLNLEHTQALKTAQEEYKKLVGGTAPEAFKTPEVQEAQQDMETLTQKVAAYNEAVKNGGKGEAELKALEEFTKGLDEGKLASYMALLAQIQEGGLGDLNLGTEEAPIKASDLLGGYNTIGDFLNAHKGTLPGLAEMFGAAGEEAMRVLVDMQLTDGSKTFKEQLDAWEANGLGVQATVSVKEATPEDGLIVEDIPGTGKLYEVKPGPGVTAKDIVASGMVTSAYVVEGTKADGTADADGQMTYVSVASDADVEKVKALGLITDAKPVEDFTAQVDANAKITGYIPSATTYFLPEGSVKASITFSGIDAAALEAWKKENPTINLSDGVSAEVGVKFGSTWKTELETAWNSNKVKLYDGNGLPIDVDPNAPNPLHANDIVAGLDEDGTYHIIVAPEWEGTPGSVKEAVGKTNTPETHFGGIIPKESTKTDLDSIIGQMKLLEAYKNGSLFDLFGWGQGKTPGAMNSFAQNPDTIRDVANAVGEFAAAVKKGEEIDPESLKIMTDIIIPALSALEQTGVGESMLATVNAGLQDLGIQLKSGEIATGLQGIVDKAKTLGADAGAGVGTGMSGYDFSTDAATTATNAENALRGGKAFDAWSPARMMIPTGTDVAAGIGQGLAAYPFTTEASTAAQTVKAAVEAALAENPISFAAQITLSGIAAIKADIASQFSTLKTDGQGYGKNLVDGIIQGLDDKADDAKRKAKSIADAIREIIRKAWDINSPSKEGAWLGGMLIEGIGVGMDRRIPDVIGRLNRLELRAQQAGGKSQVINNNQKSGDINFYGDLHTNDKQDIRALGIEINQAKVNSERALGAVYK